MHGRHTYVNPWLTRRRLGEPRQHRLAEQLHGALGVGGEAHREHELGHPGRLGGGTFNLVRGYASTFWSARHIAGFCDDATLKRIQVEGSWLGQKRLPGAAR
jgi:hypothetical protein